MNDGWEFFYGHIFTLLFLASGGGGKAKIVIITATVIGLYDGHFAWWKKFFLKLHFERCRVNNDGQKSPFSV